MLYIYVCVQLADTNQWQRDLDFFVKLHRAVESYYINDLPAWQSKPDDSVFCVLSQQEMNSKTAEEVQSILREKHIYVRRDPLLDLDNNFDDSTLRTLCPLDKSIVIHGKKNSSLSQAN